MRACPHSRTLPHPYFFDREQISPGKREDHLVFRSSSTVSQGKVKVFSWKRSSFSLFETYYFLFKGIVLSFDYLGLYIIVSVFVSTFLAYWLELTDVTQRETKIEIDGERKRKQSIRG